jgi:hypothetical protein
MIHPVTTRCIELSEEPAMGFRFKHLVYELSGALGFPTLIIFSRRSKSTTVKFFVRVLEKLDTSTSIFQYLSLVFHSPYTIVGPTIPARC